MVLCLGDLDNWRYLRKQRELYEGALYVPLNLPFQEPDRQPTKSTLQRYFQRPKEQN